MFTVNHTHSIRNRARTRITGLLQCAASPENYPRAKRTPQAKGGAVNGLLNRVPPQATCFGFVTHRAEALDGLLRPRIIRIVTVFLFGNSVTRH